MSKLYVFAIGGTGTRVLKSLTMLLASGVQANTDRIVPMIIDTDINNGDLEKYRNIIRTYNNIHNSIYSGVPLEEDQGHFFRTKIDTPRELNISGLNYGTLSEMVAYDSLNTNGFRKTRALIDLLFSEDNRQMDLENGFLGNPNIGSIVLKNVTNTSGFREFTQDFNPGDRIFIINSIFGGTGAAGLPLLLNLFRDENSGLNNALFIADAIIGGATVLPYFEVDVEKFATGESAINSNTFITKTKAALAYYNRNITSHLNAFFPIGETRKSRFENYEGGVNQKNPANFIELATAMSILEFVNYEKGAMDVSDLSVPIKYFEFGIKDDLEQISLKHLIESTGNKERILKPLITFFYYSVYITNYLKKSLSNSKLMWRKELELDSNLYENSCLQNIRGFIGKHYYRWLKEMGDDEHARKFIPFVLNITNESDINNNDNLEVDLKYNDKDLFSLVKDIPTKNNRGIFTKDKIKFDEQFSKIVNEVETEQISNSKRRFSVLTNIGIDKIYTERFQF